MAPVGLLLLVGGIMDLHWWSTPAAARLVGLFTQIRIERGAQPPALLRSGGGAVELVVIGAVCLAYAILAPLIAKGRRWARTWGLALGFGTFLIGLVSIGADASQPIDLKGYLDMLARSAAAGAIPQIKALLYPGWYAWLEDIAQGLQVLMSFAAAVALAGAVVWDPDYFASKKAATAAPDAWAAAISRIHQETVRGQDRTDEPQ
jgi:hypothetical protein